MADPFTPDSTVPLELDRGDFVLRAITLADTERDYDAVMDTRDDLRRWSQSTWPGDGFTVADNRSDIADMADRTAARRALDFTVLDATRTRSLGCVYVFPTSATFLSKAEVTAVADRNADGSAAHNSDEGTGTGEGGRPDDGADSGGGAAGGWDAVEAAVYFWVRGSEAGTGLEARLLEALRTWVRDEWEPTDVVFVTSSTFDRQVELFRSAGLHERFRIVEPTKDAPDLAFG